MAVCKLKIYFMVIKRVSKCLCLNDCFPNTDSKSYTAGFGIETLEIYISASRYRSEMFLYSKRSYGYQFSKEYGLSLIGGVLTFDSDEVW